jgi:hypothetical protein
MSSEFVDSEIDHRFHIGIFGDVRTDKRGIAAIFMSRYSVAAHLAAIAHQ